ncbi:hypothetical protein [Phaeobacter sp. 22II1-1F12B]|uniref:hypothetical protein n=1 Tax=Phaeobacter sp. 22II1-1F12B TaxID=1317111 RepID=UPI000B51F716|nr:hypothetical protein [Phaeobacter sp. 22II1-1F12B]OWU82604.1 hypothetical protein ATO1_01400 [Phaeobacter sp. 22II1-1F12B]
MVDKKISDEDKQGAKDQDVDALTSDEGSPVDMPEPKDKAETEPQKPDEPVADTAFEPESDADAEPVPLGDDDPIDTGKQDTEQEEAPVADTEFAPDENEAEPEPVLPETEEPTRSEPTRDPVAPAPTQTVVERRGGFFPALLGGIVAAILGFLAARADLLDPILPPSLQSSRDAGMVEDLSARVDAQQGEIEALREDVGNLPPPDTSAVDAQVASIGDQLGAISGRIDELSATINGLQSRVTEIEKAPINDAVSESAIAAYEDELNRLQQAMATQREEVEALVAEAREMDAQSAEQARQANALAAIARLQSAVSNGLPYADVAQEVSGSGVELPEALTSSAETGVATLSELQAEFPAAARNALADVRSSQVGTETGLGAFLQRQLGARSVEPREGSDPDAILSRAEAAVMDGNLQTAIEEIETLPEEAKGAMSEWTADARARADAMTAADGLTVSATSN